MLSGLLIAILIIFGWILLMLGLSPWIKKSKRFQLLGPLLLLKAIKRRGILDKIAERFPAIGFSRISVILILAAGIFGIIFLGYGAYLTSLITTPVNEPLTYLIGLPGINPIIPVTYGIPAFGASVVIHEVFHGIVARKHNLKVNSVGVLFFVAPMGAFVEPDEEEMNKVDPVIRRRIFASGAGINIVLGIAMLLILSVLMMPAAQPIHQGVYVEGVTQSQPFSSLVQPGQEIVGYGNYSGNSLANLFTNSTIPPGQLEPMQIFDGKSTHTVNYPSGVNIAGTLSGYPAGQAGIMAGEIIYSINGSLIYSVNGMESILENITPQSTITIVTLNYSQSASGLVKTTNSFNITTASKYSYYQQADPSANQEIYKNQSFIGVTTDYLGISAVPLSSLKPAIFLSSVFTDPWYGFLSSIYLPLTGFSPVPHGLALLFHTPFSSLVFWGLVNTIYWFYWVNILLAVTNALPVLIFDGNQFFKDTLLIAGRRKRLSFLGDERVLGRIMGALNIIIIFLFLWVIIIPRII